MGIMNDTEFYLEDLKIKFDKINDYEYFFNPVEYNDRDILLEWFILENHYNISFINHKNMKRIYSGCNSTDTCFDEAKNFYPIYDIPDEILEDIIKNYIK